MSVTSIINRMDDNDVTGDFDLIRFLRCFEVYDQKGFSPSKRSVAAEPQQSTLKSPIFNLFDLSVPYSVREHSCGFREFFSLFSFSALRYEDVPAPLLRPASPGVETGPSPYIHTHHHRTIMPMNVNLGVIHSGVRLLGTSASVDVP